MTDVQEHRQVSPVEKVCDDAIVKVLNETPEVAALMGASDLPQLRERKGALGDYSVEGLNRRASILKEADKNLQAFDINGLSSAEKLSVQIMDFFLHFPCFDVWTGVGSEQFVLHDFQVKQQDGAQNQVVETLTHFHEICSADDADAYLDRLAALPKIFDDLVSVSTLAEDRGIIPPRSSLEIVIEGLAGFMEKPPVENDLCDGLSLKLADLDQIGSVQKETLLAKAEREVADHIYPALDRLKRSLEERLPRADETLGAWRLPGGDAYYAYRLQENTTTGMTASEIHELGLDQIAEMHNEIEQAFREQGIWEGTIGASYANLQTIGDADSANETEDRGQILANAQELVSQMETQLRDHFGIYPKSTCQVIACPEHLESKRTTTYFPPSLNGKRTGLFELNLSQERSKAKRERRIVAYHEAYPGHHLQLTVAQESEDLPLFRRIVLNAAYIEGWAKYSETLPLALGLDEDPLLNLFRLRAELTSTTNLALDTGIHAKRWDRDKAVSFCAENAFLSRPFAEYLVDRISVTPGQTCAYKMGLNCMRRVRASMERSMGDRFNLKAFHDVVLEDGAMPLAILEQVASEKTGRLIS